MAPSKKTFQKCFKKITPSKNGFSKLLSQKVHFQNCSLERKFLALRLKTISYIFPKQKKENSYIA